MTELDGGSEAADKVTGKLAVNGLHTQLVSEVTVIETTEGLLEEVVECEVGLHI